MGWRSWRSAAVTWPACSNERSSSARSAGPWSRPAASSAEGRRIDNLTTGAIIVSMSVAAPFPGPSRGLGVPLTKGDPPPDPPYACLVRHGIRNTPMDDIAAAAGMSRPAVYQYVRNKDDAFRRVASRIFAEAVEEA